MTEIKALEKLRTLSMVRMDGWLRMDTQKIADEIEAEITSNYTRLPVDANGETIHIGDKLMRGERLIGTVTAVGFREAPRVWVLEKGKNASVSYLAKGVVLVKQRTIEDVLRDYACDFADSNGPDYDEEITRHYADEIRELMGGDMK